MQHDSFTVAVKTNHYNFNMSVIEKYYDSYISYTFVVGDPKKPCLKLYITYPLTDDKDRIEWSKRGALLNIDALLECSLDDINENYIKKHSFGQELLTTVDHIVKTYFPHVTTLTLFDASYLPCHRPTNDSLDLLTYSIALYGATWYEIKRNAYIPDIADRAFYENKIEKYTSKEFKSSITDEEFLRKIKFSRNEFAQDFLLKNYQHISNLYKTTHTFPEFFQGLRNMIPFADRCKFFNDWLPAFLDINKVSRDWQYDLYPATKAKKGTKRRMRKTRKKQRNYNR
jgi:hypothetical protein